MSKSNVQYKKSSFGILNILTLVFVLCKIFEIGAIATWSWWLIFTPLLLQVGVTIVVLIIVLIGAIALSIFDK